MVSENHEPEPHTATPETSGEVETSDGVASGEVSAPGGATPHDGVASSNEDVAPGQGAASDPNTTPDQVGTSDLSATADLNGTSDELTQFQEALHARLVDAIKTVYDPEIPVDIYELGLIYEIEIDEVANVVVSMTLTSPACPVAGALVAEVEEKVNQTDGVKNGKVNLVWDPQWTPEMLSESAKLELGMM